MKKGGSTTAVKRTYSAAYPNLPKKPKADKHKHRRTRREKRKELEEIARSTGADKNNSHEQNNSLVRKNSFNALELVDDETDNNISDSDLKQQKAVIIEDDDGDEVINMVADDDAQNHSEPAQGKNDGIVMIDSDSSNSSGSEKSDEKQHDQLQENTDFIAFDFSSDDEEGAKEQKSNENVEESERGINVSGINNSPIKAVNPKYPWLKSNKHTKQLEVSDWLTMEIKDFVKYISPSEKEIEARNSVVRRLNDAIMSLWPDAELHCFGSYSTDLYLPGSDIDTVVISKGHKYDNRASLYKLSTYLRVHKLGKRIETIAKAKVPIIKFVDPETGYHIDISFERDNGLTAAQIIISWIKSTPGLRELVMIVKQFLSVRRLNEVHTGGLGGFSIICLVYSFLRLHPRIVTGSIDPMDNLGVLLIEFFELYGFNFGYDNVAIAFKNKTQPIYIPKTSNQNLLNRNPFFLAIQDPQDPTNNISRGTFNLRDIKRSFGGAYEMLVNKCYEMNNATYKQRLGESILGDVIKFKGKARDFVDARGAVKNYAFQIASGEASREDLLSSGSQSETTSVGSDADYKPKSKYEFIDSSSDDDESDISSSESDRDAEQKRLYEIYEKSQSSIKEKQKDKIQKSELLMGIHSSEEQDDEQHASAVRGVTNNNISKKEIEQDFEDSSDDSGYQPTPNITKHTANKDKKREYWLQKGGICDYTQE